MRIRDIGRFTTCLFVLAAPARLLFAQQPALEAVAAQEKNRAFESLSVTEVGTRAPAAAEFLLEIASHANPVGIDVAELDPALRAQLGLLEGVGVVVAGIKPESEAAKAGLQRYDIVLKIGQEGINGRSRFDELVTAQQGQSVEIHVLRNGKPASVKLTLPKVPVYTTGGDLAELLLAETVVQAAEPRYRIGVTLAEADDTLRSQLRLASGEGLVVTEVLPDSAAEKAGIRKHDVLVKLDGKRLSTVDAANAQIQEIKDRSVSLALVRAGSEITLEVAPRMTTESSGKELMLRSLVERLHGREARDAVLFQPADRVNLNRILLNRILLTEPAPAATPSPAPPAEQIAALKKQLAEIQKSLETLEAVLRQSTEPKAGTPDK